MGVEPMTRPEAEPPRPGCALIQIVLRFLEGDQALHPITPSNQEGTLGPRCQIFAHAVNVWLGHFLKKFMRPVSRIRLPGPYVRVTHVRDGIDVLVERVEDRVIHLTVKLLRL